MWRRSSVHYCTNEQTTQAGSEWGSVHTQFSSLFCCASREVYTGSGEVGGRKGAVAGLVVQASEHELIKHMGWSAPASYWILVIFTASYKLIKIWHYTEFTSINVILQPTVLSCWKHWSKLLKTDSKLLYSCISTLLVITGVSLFIQLSSPVCQGIFEQLSQTYG